jgi:hypothetical protein
MTFSLTSKQQQAQDSQLNWTSSRLDNLIIGSQDVLANIDCQNVVVESLNALAAKYPEEQKKL